MAKRSCCLHLNRRRKAGEQSQCAPATSNHFRAPAALKSDGKLNPEERQTGSCDVANPFGGDTSNGGTFMRKGTFRRERGSCGTRRLRVKHQRGSSLGGCPSASSAAGGPLAASLAHVLPALGTACALVTPSSRALLYIYCSFCPFLFYFAKNFTSENVPVALRTRWSCRAALAIKSPCEQFRYNSGFGGRRFQRRCEPQVAYPHSLVKCRFFKSPGGKKAQV